MILSLLLNKQNELSLVSPAFCKRMLDHHFDWSEHLGIDQIDFIQFSFWCPFFINDKIVMQEMTNLALDRKLLLHSLIN